MKEAYVLLEAVLDTPTIKLIALAILALVLTICYVVINLIQHFKN